MLCFVRKQNVSKGYCHTAATGRLLRYPFRLSLQTIAMILRHIIYLLLLLSLPMSAAAQKRKIVKVKGESLLMIPSNKSDDQMKQEAEHVAIINALGNEFGRSVGSVGIEISENDERGNTRSDYYDISRIFVKGEWLKTTEGPDFEFSTDINGTRFVRCCIEGRARERAVHEIPISATLVANTDATRDTEAFNHGDPFYLRFKSPVKGFLAIYQLDANTAYRLLPYENTGYFYEVGAEEEYTFFSPENAPAADKGFVTKYYLECNDEFVELNPILIVFSPHQFYRSSDIEGGEGIPPTMAKKDFFDWLYNCRTKDAEMQILPKMVTIKR